MKNRIEKKVNFMGLKGRLLWKKTTAGVKIILTSRTGNKAIDSIRSGSAVFWQEGVMECGTIFYCGCKSDNPFVFVDCHRRIYPLAQNAE